jgi:phenylalanine-4-hydroxylase
MDLRTFTKHAGGEADLVELDPDHPGFRDPVYRQRRNEIARIALDYSPGTAVPEAPYIAEEHAVWRTVWGALAALHQAHVAREILELQRFLPLDHDRIPQLEDLNPSLENAAGFRMEPVAGLVSPRTFMRYLGRRIFLSTQYIRHHSQPFYTPEPDVVHELVGHAATLVHPGIAEVNRLLGQAADVANDTEMVRVDRVYWYTMEFGVLAENGATKAYGAGLLSSCGELEAYASTATLMDWDLERMAETAFDPTMFQSTLFVAPSFTHMLVDVSRWVRNGDWRD